MNLKAAKALVAHQGKVLLLKRARGDTWRPGDYDLPGGMVNQGEPVLAALIREVAEETGIAIVPDVITEILVPGLASNDPDVEKHAYLVRLGDIERPSVVLSREHESYVWLEPLDALRVFPHPFYGPVLEFAINRALLTRIPSAQNT